MEQKNELAQEAHIHPHRHVDGTVHAHEHSHVDREHDGPHTAIPARLERRGRRGEPLGPTRSLRLPAPLDRWFEERLMLEASRPASDLLVELIYGGLRLRQGYMAVHRRSLERLLFQGDVSAYKTYMRCLFDTFGRGYVEHLEAWLRADGVISPAQASSIGETSP